MSDSRRSFLRTASAGFGYLAFAGLSTLHASRANGFNTSFFDDEPSENPLAPKPPHFAAQAKHVIFLCMQGGPSHIDTFDYKPQLASDSGKTGSGARGGNRRLMASPWKFRQQG
ncbi:MAG: DUF1501 domain-containing protein, partial [Planctomycetota bacterium]